MFFSPFKRENWAFILGPQQSLKTLSNFLSFSNLLPHVPFKNVIHNDELEELNTIEMVVTKIYGRSTKFIYIYGDDVEDF
jgi:hypothetical protein